MMTTKTALMALFLTLACLTGCTGVDTAVNDLTYVDVPSAVPAPAPATPLSGAWVLGWVGDDALCSFTYPMWTDLELADDGRYAALSGDVAVSYGTWNYAKLDLGAGDSTNAAYLTPDASDPIVEELELTSHDAVHMGGILTVTNGSETCSYLVRFDR
jgi:hypothetical protein